MIFMAFLLSLAPAAVVVGAELAADVEIAAVVDAEVLIAEVGAVLAVDHFADAGKMRVLLQHVGGSATQLVYVGYFSVRVIYIIFVNFHPIWAFFVAFVKRTIIFACKAS